MKLLLSLFISSLVVVGLSVSAHAKDLNTGESVYFGKYNDKPISWSVVQSDDNTALLLSNDIICKKTFDIGSDHTDAMQKKYGSNLWLTSSLRHWLNSSEYDQTYNEAGFVSKQNFSLSDMALILPYEHNEAVSSLYVDIKNGGSELLKYTGNTVPTNYEQAYYAEASDYVFLPSFRNIDTLKQKPLKQAFWLSLPYVKTSYTQMAFDTDLAMCSVLANTKIGVRPMVSISNKNIKFDKQTLVVTGQTIETIAPPVLED